MGWEGWAASKFGSLLSIPCIAISWEAHLLTLLSGTHDYLYNSPMGREHDPVELSFNRPDTSSKIFSSLLQAQAFRPFTHNHISVIERPRLLITCVRSEHNMGPAHQRKNQYRWQPHWTSLGWSVFGKKRIFVKSLGTNPYARSKKMPRITTPSNIELEI